MLAMDKNEIRLRIGYVEFGCAPVMMRVLSWWPRIAKNGYRS